VFAKQGTRPLMRGLALTIRLFGWLHYVVWIHRQLEVSPVTRSKYVPVCSSANVLLAKVPGETSNYRRIVRARMALAVVSYASEIFEISPDGALLNLCRSRPAPG